MKRRCLVCGRVGTSSRCPTCEPPRRGGNWEQTRKNVLGRDSHKCVRCGKECPHNGPTGKFRDTPPPTPPNGRIGKGKSCHQVDHIWPRALGGPDTMRNLQTLCRRCHQDKTNRQPIRTARRGVRG